ncbi:MAG: InlB B-repeat-containing protein, partial [Clostridia bacterium]|nr:InlB B-repeat-containing protein [Clostridia bacterium]
MKKKLLTLLLVMVMLLGVVILASCGGDDNRPSYKIEFNLAGGTTDEDLSNVTVKKGDKLWQPKDPVKEGATFDGWYNGAKKWDFENDTVTKKITLDAWWSGDSSGSTSSCEHDYQISKQQDATCTQGGWIQYKCTICRGPFKEKLDALGHDLDVKTYQPTCAEKGYTHTVCKNGCGMDTKSNYIEATGKHDYSSFEIVYEATDYTAGLEQKECSVCHGKISQVIEPLCEQFYLKDLEINNFLYTGGKYENEPFVNINNFAGTTASSFYTVALSSYANDRDYVTYWQADTLVDGAKYTGEYLQLNFNEKFDIGKIVLSVPSYYSWQLGENHYVSYDIEALIDGKWVKIGEIDDRNAPANTGVYAYLECILSEPVNTDSVRAVVTHGSRFTPAKIHEFEVYAKTKEIYRLPQGFASATNVSVSGKYNEYASGGSSLIDGNLGTEWYTNAKHATKEQEVKAWAILDFGEEKLVPAVQFATAQTKGRKFRLLYEDASGEWVTIGEYEVTTAGDPNGAFDFCNVGGTNIAICSAVINNGDGVRTSKLQLQILNEPVYWESYVYSFDPYTVIEEAKNLDRYSGCLHSSFQSDKHSSTVKVAPTCTTAGYSTVQCRCGEYTITTNRVSATGHTWSDFKVTAVATETEMGTQTSTCTCGATKTRAYSDTYAPAVVTKYFKNAPAAWAQGLDDGNYISTYEWFAPVLNEYRARNNGVGYKATVLMTIGMMDIYVDNWHKYFATGAFDLGSHTQTHSGSYSSTQINESYYLTDINSAHFWFMSRFRGQQLLSFATPNGATSDTTAIYINGLMQCGRNGGDRTYLNLLAEYTKEVNWGNMNAYQSKANQSEGLYFFVKDGKFYSAGGALGALNLEGSFGKVVVGYDKSKTEDGKEEPDPNKPIYGDWL